MDILVSHGHHAWNSLRYATLRESPFSDFLHMREWNKVLESDDKSLSDRAKDNMAATRARLLVPESRKRG